MMMGMEMGWCDFDELTLTAQREDGSSFGAPGDDDGHILSARQRASRVVHGAFRSGLRRNRVVDRSARSIAVAGMDVGQQRLLWHTLDSSHPNPAMFDRCTPCGSNLQHVRT